MAWHPAHWKWRKPKYGAREDKTIDADRYGGYLSLKLEHDGFAWFTARGCSMLSVFSPMERVKVVPVTHAVTPGDIVVFSQGAKLTAHRIVGRYSEKKLWVTKGDTLAHFDRPLARADILGCVEAVQGWRGKRTVAPDMGALKLSSTLARKLCGHREERPALVKFYLYILAFMILFPFRNQALILKMLSRCGDTSKG